MAITKCSSLLLLSLMMMFLLISNPVNAGETNRERLIKHCTGMDCTTTEKCNAYCIEQHFLEGKCLERYLVGGVECCCLA
ncbi:putative defensin-like protein 86 [Capsella rubella]|uniref:putative defensin-like protein 86 n=1 Tax=Capsella rubella TaxID=81985 RepID=UPI000CD4D633|nr:putative defensin-like protein 86 [Capsella rubella]